MDKVYVIGGRSATTKKGATFFNNIKLVDFKNKKFETIEGKGDSPPPIAFHSSCSIGRTLYISGGGNEKDNNTSIWSLNLETFEWAKMNVDINLSIPIRSPHLCTISRIEILFLGYEKKTNLFNEVAICTIANNAVTGVKAMPMKGGKYPPYREDYTFTRVLDYVYLFGGVNNNTSFNDLWILFYKESVWYVPICSGAIPPPRYALFNNYYPFISFIMNLIH